MCNRSDKLCYRRNTLKISTLRRKAGSRIRTDDLLITNQLLYQLSYAGVYEGKYSLTRLRRVPFYTPFLYGKV
jgi:hypothetical protein